MPPSSKLKVFKLPIGFHDAYVAAPSQKAAAEAWGTDVAVFARGEAELVTDPKLSEEPLASPGKVIKRLRGTAEEQIAALGSQEAPAKARKGKPAEARKAGAHVSKTPRAPPPKPRPSRAALDEAEAALAEAETAQAEARREYAEREAALARDRAALEKKGREERERLEARRDKAEAAYEEALRRWRG